MLRKNNSARFLQAFTLVELILVMVLLTTMAALVVPSMSGTFRQHKLDQEGGRLLAAIEYARDEAVSQGAPTVVWIDPDAGSFGVEAATGYEDSGVREKQFLLNGDLHFDVTKTNVIKDGRVQAVQFEPDGSPGLSGVDSIGIVGQSNVPLLVAKTTDGWGYEIVKEGDHATARR